MPAGRTGRRGDWHAAPPQQGCAPRAPCGLLCAPPCRAGHGGSPERWLRCSTMQRDRRLKKRRCAGLTGRSTEHGWLWIGFLAPAASHLSVYAARPYARTESRQETDYWVEHQKSSTRRTSQLTVCLAAVHAQVDQGGDDAPAVVHVQVHLQVQARKGAG